MMNKKICKTIKHNYVNILINYNQYIHKNNMMNINLIIV